MDSLQAEKFFYTIKPTANVTDNDKKHWITRIMSEFKPIAAYIHQMANEKTKSFSIPILNFGRRQRGKRVTIEPIHPMDVLALLVECSAGAEGLILSAGMH